MFAFETDTPLEFEDCAALHQPQFVELRSEYDEDYTKTVSPGKEELSLIPNIKGELLITGEVRNRNDVRWNLCNIDLKKPFTSYLCGRRQATAWKSSVSPVIGIKCGVAQRSILCSTLFNLYINNLPVNISTSRICLYANDTLLTVSAVTIKSLKTTSEITVNKRPKDVHQLRKFLGLINYYHHSIPALASKVAQLNVLLRKDAPFEWSKQCDRSFKKPKEEITAKHVTLQTLKDELKTKGIVELCKQTLSTLLKEIGKYGKEKRRALIEKPHIEFCETSGQHERRAHQEQYREELESRLGAPEAGLVEKLAKIEARAIKGAPFLKEMTVAIGLTMHQARSRRERPEYAKCLERARREVKESSLRTFKKTAAPLSTRIVPAPKAVSAATPPSAPSSAPWPLSSTYRGQRHRLGRGDSTRR
ncbi:hypothetical protein Trydic_g15983 [Trypoxylus dichotomus]